MQLSQQLLPQVRLELQVLQELFRLGPRGKRQYVFLSGLALLKNKNENKDCIANHPQNVAGRTANCFVMREP